MEVNEISNYEFWSLLLTGTYDLLTFLLLAFTGYIALFQPRVPNISFYYQTVPKDTKEWGWRRSNIDFVLENRGFELRNMTLRSEPDDLGWANFGNDDPNWQPKATSQYFKKPTPYLDQNAKKRS